MKKVSPAKSLNDENSGSYAELKIKFCLTQISSRSYFFSVKNNNCIFCISSTLWIELCCFVFVLFQCHGELRYARWRLGAVLLLAGSDVAAFPVPALLGCGKVGWPAHVAGALAGPLLGLAVFPNQSKKDARGRRFVKFVRFISAVSLMLLVVGAILGNVYLIALPQLRKPS